ncbi:hypothetical protein [Paenibacillus cookii]|uniref:Uncharacterized protein n=1 Tax=Paenibacillus cookii TaxID=157839 RepID=A0ABQ4M444_9BACL|nr:hypothetical protein [Paenibacillus cookii]GIO70183.1 hypothetical protein J21TS3_50040 [Paenibacillus cookii]
MVKHSKKFIAATSFCALLLGGVAHAASNQFADATLQTGASTASSSYINGNDQGEYGGYLTVQRGRMKIAAKRVVAYWPDPSISYFTTNTTSLQSASIGMTPDTDLYYVELSPELNAPTGWGYIQNY